MAAKKTKRPKKVKEEDRSANKAIGERNQVALAYIELARDKTFQKLSEEQKFKLVKEVLDIGTEVADWVLSEYGINDPRKIAAKMGVKVFGEEQRGRGRVKGSEYRKEKKEIVIYRNFHERLLREVRSRELSEHLLKFIVAHELFHHLEVNRIGEVYKRFKFPVWKIGPYVKEGYVMGLSDVAAQAFTQRILGLEILPETFDYLTYILYTNR